MALEIWLVYVTTILILMSTPGPSHLLMMSNSMANGFQRSIATAAGDLSANILQMLAAGLGLAVVLSASQYGFTIIKWAGVAYLVWLGIRQIMRSFATLPETNKQEPVSLKILWLQGFVTSAANPKAVVFFAALFPQFIHPQFDFWLQMLILGGTYIIIDGLFLCLYGSSAGWIAKKMQGHMRVWMDRFAGCCLISAAILLGLKSVQKS